MSVEQLRNLGPFILGTAQLGMPYGIHNMQGRLSECESETLIRSAFENGLTAFDTAIAYGDAEERLGRAIPKSRVHEVSVMTKIGSDGFDSIDACTTVVRNALRRVQIERFHTVYVHAFQELRRSADLARMLLNVKESGLTEFIGVSVYTGQEALDSLSLDFVDVIQMPLNALDWQAINFRVKERAVELGKQLIFRSVYLQGLLLMNPKDLPGKMKFALSAVQAWSDICEKHSLSKMKAALKIAQYLAGGFPLVIGCESPSQVEDNANFLMHPVPNLEPLIEDASLLAERTSDVLRNPSKW